jgi:transposase InsO family protein
MTSADALSRIPRNRNQTTTEPLTAQAADEGNESDNTELFQAAVTTGPRERTVLVFDEPDTDVAVVANVQQLPTTADLTTELPQCPGFGALYAYLASGQLPIDDADARRVVLQAEDYVLEDGVLLHLFKPRTKRLDRANAIRQVCIPRCFRQEVARALHDDNCHIGSDRLYSTARLRSYFPDMYAFLREHVRTCLKCQIAKRPIHPGQVPVGALPLGPPCLRWVGDFHGPFPQSNGHRYILAFIDSTSLWPELCAVPNTSAETVVQALFDCVISRYGWPLEIALQTENGSGFTAKLTALFCKTFNVKQHFSTAYHPQSQSRVEAFADTIHKSLRVLCKKQTDWSKHLSAVAMAYRASATTSLGLSPHEVLFGRAFKFAIDHSLAISELVSSNPQVYAAEIKPKLEILSYLAMQNARESADKHRERANERATEPTFKVGDQVLVYNPVTRKNDSAKLTVRYVGPYVATDVDDRRNYRLQLLSTGKPLKRAVHASRLRPLIQLDNDYRIQQRKQETTVYEARTNIRRMQITVRIGDPLEQTADALVVSINEQVQPIGEASRLICEKAGCTIERTELADRGVQPLSGILPTPAGQLTSVKQIL